MTYYKALLEELKNLKTKGVTFHYCGICGNIDEKIPDNLFKLWPKYSGCSAYPVPHPEIAPEDAYDKYDDLWEDNEYGNNRRELLDFLIEKLEGGYDGD